MFSLVKENIRIAFDSIKSQLLRTILTILIIAIGITALVGILSAVSGYSGGTTKNPTYKEVTYGNTGHFETVKIIYDSEIISYQKVLDVYWKNIDPFDSIGQFCDKGYSYRSVVFYTNTSQKNIIENSVKDIELKFDKKIVTYIKKFDKFYEAETYHQDYYKQNFINYLMYKNSCGREKILKKIWN